MEVVCITGMHRSGTSVVARIVNLLGIDLGPTDQMVGAAHENPRGFWENATIQAFNDRLLRHLGGHWADPPAPRPGWESSTELEPHRERAREILRDVFGASSTKVGWKDPRTSLLLPFWRTVSEIDATVLVIREPREVARSLEKRNGFDPEHASYLWVRYVSSAWLDDPHRLVIDHDRFRSDISTHARRIAEHLGLPSPGDEQLAAIQNFYDPSLHRERAERAEAVGPLQALAIFLYELIRDGEGDVVRPIIAALSEGWPRTGPYGTAAEEHDRLKERIHELEHMYRGAELKYERLRDRRSVRIALKLVQPIRRVRGYTDEL